ncbi:MAG TPA: flagellar hook-length control protein FliK [Rhodanobacteraceae bacterium]|nr:flagellar hook-length control protein FliK [Rhodanobacteraceae bacterium]
MSVPPIQMAALDWVAAAAGTQPRPWPIGSVVSGRVLEVMEETRLILQINGLTVEAEQPPDGMVPRNFQARVVDNGPQLILELLGQPGKSLPTTAALRARLPHQGSLQPLLADLHALASTPGARALPEPVRVALARLEASITDRHDTLDPDVLRDTLRRAGLQLEHTLLQSVRTSPQLPTTQVDYDIKAALQRLAQTLLQLPQGRTTPPAGSDTPPPLLPQERASPPAGSDTPPPLLPQERTSPPPGSDTPPLLLPQERASLPAGDTPAPPLLPQERTSLPAGSDPPPPLLHLPLQPQARLPVSPAADALDLAAGMLKHVQAALSRIEIMQLEVHPSALPQACMIEVPIRGDDGFDVLQVRIEKDAGGNPDVAPSHWTLGFTLEPPGLGAIHGLIRLRGVKVDVDLWAQHDAAVRALEEQTLVLSRLLEGSGLELVQLRIRQGTPLRHTGLARRLLEASA